MGLPGFGIGIIIASFQMAGMSELDRERLKRWVRNKMPWGPKFLRWSIFILSGPSADELLDAAMAFWTASGVRGWKEWFSVRLWMLRCNRRLE